MFLWRTNTHLTITKYDFSMYARCSWRFLFRKKKCLKLEKSRTIIWSPGSVIRVIPKLRSIGIYLQILWCVELLRENSFDHYEFMWWDRVIREINLVCIQLLHRLEVYFLLSAQRTSDRHLFISSGYDWTPVWLQSRWRRQVLLYWKRPQ